MWGHASSLYDTTLCAGIGADARLGMPRARPSTAYLSHSMSSLSSASPFASTRQLSNFHTPTLLGADPARATGPLLQIGPIRGGSHRSLRTATFNEPAVCTSSVKLARRRAEGAFSPVRARYDPITGSSFDDSPQTTTTPSFDEEGPLDRQPASCNSVRARSRPFTAASKPTRTLEPMSRAMIHRQRRLEMQLLEQRGLRQQAERLLRGRTLQPPWLSPPPPPVDYAQRREHNMRNSRGARVNFEW